MPKITNFAFCEEVNLDENSPQAIDLIQMIETKTESFSFSIMYTITGFTSHEDHQGYILLFDADNEQLIKTDEFLVGKDEKMGDQEKSVMTGLTMGVEFGNVQFKGSGLYKIELFFDESLMGEFYIPVILKKEGEQT